MEATAALVSIAYVRLLPQCTISLMSPPFGCSRQCAHAKVFVELAPAECLHSAAPSVHQRERGILGVQGKLWTSYAIQI
jgi:hypothetical protein